MSAVATGIVASAVIGGVVADRQGTKAAGAQRDAARQAGNTELAMYDQNREDLAPFRESGYGALNELNYGLGLNVPGASTTQSNFDAAAYLQANPDVAADSTWSQDPYGHYQRYGKNEGRAFTPTAQSSTPTQHGGTFGDLNRDFTLADFHKDPSYDFRMSEGQNALESSAAARGGLLNGGTIKALTRYGQDFASNEYSNAYNRFNADRTQRFNRLSALAGTGQQATNTTATLGANTANNVAESQLQAGNARAANAINTGNAVNNTASSLGQFYLQQQYYKKPPTTYTPTRGGYSSEIV